MVVVGCPGAGWSYRGAGQCAFGRVERLHPRVWLVVEDDRFDEHPFLYIVVGSESVCLIDSGVGTQPYADWLDGFLMGAAGFAASQLPRICINTSCLYTKIGGNASLGDDATICASSRDRSFTGAAFDDRRDSGLKFQVGCRELQPYTVRRWLGDGDVVDLGGGDRLVALHAPGRTPDSLCLWYEREALLFAGDTIYPDAPIVVAHRESSLVQFLSSLVKLNAFLAAAPRFTIACGRIAEALPGDRLAALQALVDDAICGRIQATRAEGLDGHLFSRGDLSFTTHHSRFEAAVPEAPPPPTAR